MKDYKELRIIFMGTPDFAVASLNVLLQDGCNVVAVITAPDRPGGRGMQLQESAVKKFASSKGLLILQPEKLKAPEFLDELRTLRADLQCVVAFRMLPEVVWNMPPLGTVNVHGSLLPQYRGAAPINWAIINGEKITGVTTFRLQQEIDTGNILLSEAVSIEDADDAGTIHDKLKEIGATLLLKTVKGLADDSLHAVPQAESAAFKHAPKIFTETAEIDWKNPVENIYNLIRGLAPYPGAFSTLQGKKVKLFKSAIIQDGKIERPGVTETDGKTYLRFAASNGFISVLELQPEGKKRMTIKEFLRGFRP